MKGNEMNNPAQPTLPDGFSGGRLGGKSYSS
jgi:hypothetical protein